MIDEERVASQKKKEKKKKLETKTRWTKMNLKRMVRGWKNNAKKKKRYDEMHNSSMYCTLQDGVSTFKVNTRGE